MTHKYGTQRGDVADVLEVMHNATVTSLLRFITQQPSLFCLKQSRTTDVRISNAS